MQPRPDTVCILHLCFCCDIIATTFKRKKPDMPFARLLLTSFAFSIAALAQTATTSIVALSLNNPFVGQPVNLTATVTPPATGTVEFLDGFRILRHAVLNGTSQATLPIRFRLPQTYRIRAVYSGKAGFAVSTSSVLAVVVKQNPVTSFTGRTRTDVQRRLTEDLRNRDRGLPPLDFTAGFAGRKTIWMLSYGSDGSNIGWREVGEFTVSGGRTPSGDPRVVSLAGVFLGPGLDNNWRYTATFSHPGGAQQLYLGYMLFLPTPNVVQYTAQGTCLIEYNRISNGIRLINDAGNDWLGGTSGIPVGTRGAALANAYCTVDVSSATVNVQTTTLSYTVPVTFNRGTLPVRLGTFLQAQDLTGKWTGMTQFGSQTVNVALAVKPGVQIGGVAGGPSLITVQLRPDITGPLTQVHIRVASSIVGSPACHIVYFNDANTLNMVNDAETALVSPVNITPGTAGTLANSRCSINTANVTRTTNAGDVSVAFGQITYNGANFSGAKKVYVAAFDGGGYTTHWLEPDFSMPPTAVPPPPAPTPHSVSLTWNASTTPNPTGYNVYRATAPTGPYTKLNASPLPGLSYVDYLVASGQMYFYVATSVDVNNIESAYSDQAMAIVPTP